MVGDLEASAEIEVQQFDALAQLLVRGGAARAARRLADAAALVRHGVRRLAVRAAVLLIEVDQHTGEQRVIAVTQRQVRADLEWRLRQVIAIEIEVAIVIVV
jgi:hypothetical protein